MSLQLSHDLVQRFLQLIGGAATSLQFRGSQRRWPIRCGGYGLSFGFPPLDITARVIAPLFSGRIFGNIDTHELSGTKGTTTDCNVRLPARHTLCTLRSGRR